MNVDLRNEVIPASGQLILPPANYLFIVQASANVSVLTQKDGNTEQIGPIGAGLWLARIKPYSRVVIQGTAGTTLSLFYGNQVVREDTTIFQSTIATISGGVTTSPATLNTITDAAPNVVNNATQQAMFGTSLTRKRITITVDANATGPVYARVNAGANNLLQMSPGQSYTFNGTYSMDVRNDTGAAVTLYRFEESA